jgi:hypothetical protein
MFSLVCNLSQNELCALYVIPLQIMGCALRRGHMGVNNYYNTLTSMHNSSKPVSKEDLMWISDKYS